jgi:Protein of unknown function (DUF3224)
LDDRDGGFALIHFGQMHAGSEELRINITPGSGTGALAGIQGELLIRRDAGELRKFATRAQVVSLLS